MVNNIAPHNGKLQTFIKEIAPVIQMKTDALIMSDPGLIMMVREQFRHAYSFIGASKRSELGNSKFLGTTRR